MNTPRIQFLATRRCGRWIGVCRIGAVEHQTIAGYDSRSQAVQAGRALAVQLNDAALGMAWWNHIPEIERAHRLARANSAVPADAWATFQRETAREPGQEVNRP